MRAEEYKISKEKFVFHSTGKNIHDTKLETKPVSYLRDAFNRFARNKGSIFAAIVIGLLVLFAIVAPIVSPYTVAYEDTSFQNVLPKCELFEGTGFWDGTEQKVSNRYSYTYNAAIEEETGKDVIIGDVEINIYEYFKQTKIEYKYRLDTYAAVGAKFIKVTPEQYAAIQAYQDETGIQIILPITEPSLRPTSGKDGSDANFWYKTKVVKEKTEIDWANDPDPDVVGDESGLVNIYRPYTGTDNYTSIVRFEENGAKLYDYMNPIQGGLYEIRVDYNEYYVYYHQVVKKDGIMKPVFLFGANGKGKDIFTCLASGARFSFILSIIVASVNLIVGAIYGAIEGYYGGKADLIMERIIDILAAIPFMIVITLLKYHMKTSQVLILFISFFLTGWIGMAGRTRMQFYRFKNQEYVLVARTLGAKDSRVMFKHIFPNAIGTLITGSVLVIPSVIFSETSLSYLGIINLESGNITSVGTLLSQGQDALFTNPHIIIPPAIFISLLMLSFNLFGNGLRDAFNPSLRGTEE